MKHKSFILSVLLCWLFIQSALPQQSDVVIPTGDISELFQPKIFPSVFPKQLLTPEATLITFDDVVVTGGGNSIEIAPNRYPGISFYSPYPNVSTWATYSRSYSYPNSLIVGHICNSSLGTICSWHAIVVDFAQDSRDVSFFWGRDSSYGNGTIEVYEGSSYQLVANLSVNLPGEWSGFSLNPYSQRIRRIILRHTAANTPNTNGHIFLDNFQFTPVTTRSPIGNFDTVSIEQAAALGWSLDPDNPSASNKVHCYIDNQGFGVIANNPSPDVPYPGDHRFSLPIPIQFRDGVNHQINCYGLDTGSDPVTLLNGSPKTFKFNTPIGNFDSISSSISENLENLVSDGNAVGWSMDTDSPRRSNTVHFYIDGPAGSGVFAGEAYAYLPRPDVNQQMGVPGNHGFDFAIPDQFRNGAQHTIWAYGIDLTGDQSKQLLGSPKTFTLNPRILSTELVPIDSAITINPNAGGGRRIFPDKQTPDETNINRRKVLIKTTISPVQANRMVYFKKYDLDDPSTDVPPVDNNGNQGNDNRGNANTPESAGTFNLIGSCVSNQNGIGCLTDANGVATIEFWTTMQPGDNFTVATSFDPNYLNAITMNGIDLVDSDNNTISQTPYVPSAKAKRTEMLTVWRKLHIEVDSMGAVRDNYVSGTIPNDVTIRRNQTITINLNPDSTLQPDRFEGGRLVVGNNSLPVPCIIANGDTCNTTNTVTVTNTGTTTVVISANSDFTLYDDDDFNDDDGASPDGDNREDISPMPDTSLLQQDSDDITTNVFAPAYVHPRYDIGDNNDSVDFVANYTGTAPGTDAAYIRSLYDFDQVATEASSEFWTIYLLGAYQSTIFFDGDPFSEDAHYGVVDSSSDTAFIGYGASIFMEAGRPEEYPLNWTGRPVSRAHTVAHEIGHLFKGIHDDHGLMDPTGSRTSGIFAPDTLDKIRDALFP